MLLLGILGLAAFGFLIALSMDGAISRSPLETLANFPFKGLPATNGVTFVFVVGTIAMLSHWLLLSAGRTM